MKTLNKTLSLILALAMVFGLMGVASAAFTDQSKITHTTAVDTCVALNIINGYNDGSYGPSAAVTRGELCKMICTAYNGGVAPTLATTATPTYTDTANHWASAYIEYCTKLGIVSGTGNGMFDPDGTVTGTQAAKMMLVALGYNAANEGFTGTNWDVAVNVRANEKKLYDGLVNFDPATGLNRDNAAQMIYNMVYATEVEYSYSITTDANGAVKTTPVLKDKMITVDGTTYKEPFVEDKYDLSSNTGYLCNVTYNTAKQMYAIHMQGNDYTYYSKTDVSKYYGMKVKVLFSYDSNSNRVVYGVVPSDSSVVSSGLFGTIAQAYGAATYTGTTTNLLVSKDETLTNATQFTDDNSKTYKFNQSITTTPVYYFNVDTSVDVAATSTTSAYSYNALVNMNVPTTGTAYTVATLGTDFIVGKVNKWAAYSYEFIDNDADGKINCVVVYPYTVQKVTSISSNEITSKYVKVMSGTTAYDAKSLDDLNAYTGIAKGDYIKVTPAACTVEGKDKLEKITPMSGTVTKLKGIFNSTVTMSTQKCYVGEVSQWLFNATGETATLGSYTDVIQVNGFIYVATVKSSITSSASYALLTWADDASGSHEAKLLFADGTSKIVDTDLKYNDASYSSDGKTVTSTALYYRTTPILVTYTIDSSTGLYSLLAASVGPYDGTAYTTSSTGDYRYNTNGTVDTYKIADDAVIFANIGGGTAYKVLTGAQLKAASAATFQNAYYNTSSTTGYQSIELGYVTMSNYTSGDLSYGYVTSNVVASNADGKSVYEITFWDGTEHTMQTKANVDLSSIVAGDFIKYTTNSDGTIAATELAKGTDIIKGYISALDGTSLTVKKAADNSTAASVSTSINSTTTKVITINSAKQTGVAGTDLEMADSTTTSGVTTWTPNVYYISGADAYHAFTLIVIDSNKNMQ